MIKLKLGVRISNNRERKPTMPEESAAEEKAKAFAENPNDFVNIHDCLIAVQTKENGFSRLMHCQSIEEVFMVKGYCEEMLQNRRDQIRVAIAKKNKSIIQPASSVPGNGGAFGKSRL